MEEWDLLVPCGDGESNDHESVKLFLKKEAWKEKLKMGTLDTKRIRQYTFDLFFNKNFEVSHDRKQGYVHYFGYTEEDQFKVEDSDTSKTLAENTENDDTPRKWFYASSSRDTGNDHNKKGQVGRRGTSSTSRLLGSVKNGGDHGRIRKSEVFVRNKETKLLVESSPQISKMSRIIPAETRPKQVKGVNLSGSQRKNSQGAFNSDDANAAGRMPKKPPKNTLKPTSKSA